MSGQNSIDKYQQIKDWLEDYGRENISKHRKNYYLAGNIISDNPLLFEDAEFLELFFELAS